MKNVWWPQKRKKRKGEHFNTQTILSTTDISIYLIRAKAMYSANLPNEPLHNESYHNQLTQDASNGCTEGSRNACYVFATGLQCKILSLISLKQNNDNTIIPLSRAVLAGLAFSQRWGLVVQSKIAMLLTSTGWHCWVYSIKTNKHITREPIVLSYFWI